MLTALKKLLRQTAPVRLRGAGKFCGFRSKDNRTFRGLTKRLAEAVFSQGILPAEARKGEKRGKIWKGAQGGRKRGKAIDRQVSAIVNNRPPKRLHRLTKIVMNALGGLNLKPVIAQRGVAHAPSNVASAADIIAYDKVSKRLVVIELKTGHAYGKLLPAKHKGVDQTMQDKFHNVSDCVAHRHLAQLSATRQMLVNEKDLMDKLTSMGVECVEGMLLYATDMRVETILLENWWKVRGGMLLQSLV
jgi:hypothetical protein